MNKLEYVNKLIEKENLSDYINQIEENMLISPPNDLKDKIIQKCYDYENLNKTDKHIKTSKYKFKFIDILKVACFALIITLCTEVFMNATYASTKANSNKPNTQKLIYKISDKLDNLSKELSDYILSYNLKGE